MPLHSAAVDSELHRPGYYQTSDPGAIGAGKVWVDTTNTPYEVKIRNAANTGWQPASDRYIEERAMFFVHKIDIPVGTTIVIASTEGAVATGPITVSGILTVNGYATFI